MPVACGAGNRPHSWTVGDVVRARRFSIAFAAVLFVACTSDRAAQPSPTTAVPNGVVVPNNVGGGPVSLTTFDFAWLDANGNPLPRGQFTFIGTDLGPFPPTNAEPDLIT